MGFQLYRKEHPMKGQGQQACGQKAPECLFHGLGSA
jgi:hypothetical protein